MVILESLKSVRAIMACPQLVTLFQSPVGIGLKMTIFCKWPVPKLVIFKVYCTRNRRHLKKWMISNDFNWTFRCEARSWRNQKYLLKTRCKIVVDDNFEIENCNRNKRPLGHPILLTLVKSIRYLARVLCTNWWWLHFYTLN